MVRPLLHPPTEEVVRTEYPRIMHTPELVAEISRWVASTGCKPSHTRPAMATCRDDTQQDMIRVLDAFHFLPAFNAHTLAGLPRGGRTLFTAFYHHIPDDGIGVIIYGPHIGIDSQGRWGCVERHHRSHPGHSCGALWAVYDNWKQGIVGPYEDDAEISAISEALLPYKNEILQETQEKSHPVRRMAELVYEVGLANIREYIKAVQSTDDEQHPILLVAGLNIDQRFDDNNKFDLREITLYTQGEATHSHDYTQ